jgi:hemoglobin
MTSLFALDAREAKRADAARYGVDAAFVSELVDRFYERVRQDPLIGPVFNARIDDWTPHLEQMKRFWRSVLLNSGEFHGNPMLKHLIIPGLNDTHFSRWLELFDATLSEQGGPDARKMVMERATLIGRSLLAGIARHRGNF